MGSRSAFRPVPAVVLLVGASVACGGVQPIQRIKERRTPPMEAMPPASSQAELQLAEGGFELDLACGPDVEERCDGVDNNCDGAIDEGCGLALGALQITATWADAADLQLEVTGPDGAPVDDTHFDHRSGCRLKPPGVRLENAHWERPPEPGRYRIHLARQTACEDGGNGAQGSVIASLAVVFSGQTLGVVNRSLEAGERVHVADLVLAP